MLNLYRTAIRGLPAEVWWYSAAAFVNRAGTMVLPFLALYLRDALQFSATDVGRILAAFGAGSLAGTFFSGALIDRFGGHRVQIGSLVLSGLAFIALVPLTSFIGLTVGVFGAAAVSEIFRPAVTSAIGSVIDPKDRARGFAVLRLAVNAGMAVGPALGGLAAQVDFTLIFWGEGITCILAGLFLAAAPVAAKSAIAADKPKSAPLAALKDVPFLAYLILVFMTFVSFFQLFFTIPLYLKDVYAWSEASVGLLIGTNAALIVVFELPIVTAMQKKTPLLVYAVGAVLLSLSFGALTLGTHASVPILMIVVITFAEILLFPIGLAIVANRASDAAMGRYMAAYSTTAAAAFIVAPWLGMSLYDPSGSDALWGAAAAAAGVVALLSAGPVRRLMTPHSDRAPSSRDETDDLF